MTNVQPAEIGDGLRTHTVFTHVLVEKAELYRAILEAFGNVAADDDAWKRVQAGIQQQYTKLNDQLGTHGHDPQAEIVDEGVFAITCAFHGQACTMTALRQPISEEIQSREQMLNAREREVIENHLIGEVATELQNLKPGR